MALPSKAQTVAASKGNQGDMLNTLNALLAEIKNLQVQVASLAARVATLESK